MGNVTDINDYKPHLSGEAKCMHCAHEWVAVSPVGEHSGFECPSCSLFKGVFVGESLPEPDQPFWQCNCGCDVFSLTPNGAMCRNCGITTDDWMDEY